MWREKLPVCLFLLVLKTGGREKGASLCRHFAVPLPSHRRGRWWPLPTQPFYHSMGTLTLNTSLRRHVPFRCTHDGSYHPTPAGELLFSSPLFWVKNGQNTALKARFVDARYPLTGGENKTTNGSPQEPWFCHSSWRRCLQFLQNSTW